MLEKSLVTLTTQKGQRSNFKSWRESTLVQTREPQCHRLKGTARLGHVCAVQALITRHRHASGAFDTVRQDFHDSLPQVSVHLLDALRLGTLGKIILVAHGVQKPRHTGFGMGEANCIFNKRVYVWRGDVDVTVIGSSLAGTVSNSMISHEAKNVKREIVHELSLYGRCR